MFKTVARFLPGLPSALGLFANPWVLLAIAVAVFAVFMFGLRLGLAQLHTLEAQIEAQARIREAWVKQRVTDQQTITKRKDDEHDKKVQKLDSAVTTLNEQLRNISGRDLLSGVSPAPESGGASAGDGGIVCFSRNRLRDAISTGFQRFAQRYGASVQRGASAIVGFDTCAAWAIEQEAKAKADKPPE